MIKVKCNKGGLASLIGAVESLKSNLGAVFSGGITKAQTTNSNALTVLDTKLNNTSPTISDGNGGTKDNPDYVEIQGKIKTAERNKTALKNALDKQKDISSTLDTVIDGLKKIQKAINKFESETGDVEFTVDASVKTVTNGATGIEVKQLVFKVTDQDGTTREFTMSELLNAFYTTQGMEMNSVYQSALLREQLGLGPLTDEDIVHVLQTSKSIMNFVFDIGMYGISSEEDLKNYKQNLKDAGFNVSTDVSSLLKGVDFGDDDLKKKALNYLLSATNGAVFPGAVSAGVSGLFGLYNNDSKVELKPDENNNNNNDNNNNNTNNYNDYGNYSSRGGGSSGGAAGVASTTEKATEKEVTDPLEIPTITPTETSKTESLTETLTEPVPGTVSPTESNTEPLATEVDASELPTELLPSIPDDLIRDYDDLARQQFEAQGEEEIAKHRAEIIERANTLFAMENKSQLMEILKKYGYSDTDIAIIIQDKNMTVSAMISGDQREQLAKIANELAQKDGVVDYDTVYDNDQSSSALTDGSTTKLLSILSSDEGVKKAYGELETAEKTYTEANTALTTAMASVTAAQAKLVEITNSIGEGIKSSPSQWDAETLKAYNEEVSKLYENSVKLNGESSKWTTDQRNDYDKRVEEIKGEYALKTAVTFDKASWSKEQAQQYNEAMNAYNDAVNIAKEAMIKLTEAKTDYSQAQANLNTAKETFYSKVIEEQKKIEEMNAQASVADPISSQDNSGDVVIEGIEVTEQGASIHAVNNNQIVNDDEIKIELPSQVTNNRQTPGVPKEEIINDDGDPIDYGIPVVDIGPATSGLVSNDDINF